ncbi:spore protease YyaC [Bacillus sp. FJAT-50079]|uniref:spore protease YyaC n=1 Tax=Bacillus sp. FJAT-50079 TaxID=2833577 RepID=UPI001BC9CDB0|nr:spore protease YyaC [Bacillus sp. FJAT-50079]MBS4207160.1 spore protease YyaC [Bacillus sp. FJAT-50079]
MKPRLLFNVQKQNEIRVKYDEEASSEKLSKAIIEYLPFGHHRPIVIVCIGTDRSTGDSLGPLTGTFLEEAGLRRFHLYGTLDDPVHAVNLQEKLSYIQKHHFRPFIIGIDACLGKVNNIGSLKVGDGPVKPGAGVNKDLPFVGNIHITGVVNVSGYMEFFVLQNTRLNLVMKMAKQMASAIIDAERTYSMISSSLQLEWDMNDEAPAK